jgi:hypothetical protein
MISTEESPMMMMIRADKRTQSSYLRKNANSQPKELSLNVKVKGKVVPVL